MSLSANGLYNKSTKVCVEPFLDIRVSRTLHELCDNASDFTKREAYKSQTEI